MCHTDSMLHLKAKTLMIRILMAATLVASLTSVDQAMAASDPGSAGSREFLMSCVYGTVAGTLVGTATLAFTAKPNQNLNRVARGASLGLYAGIILGLYVVYGTSEDDADPVVFAPAPVVDPVTGNMDGGMFATAFTF